MRQWRLIYETPLDGARNMAIDEAILESVSAVKVLPTLRFYAWSPPCLSLGYGQSVRDVDFKRIADAGWLVVRRPTGGRAILHVDELTYSVAIPVNHPIAAGSIVESYRRISQALLTGLRELGLHPNADRRTQRGESGAAVCFDTPSHYEITVHGRKLVGSAQARRGGGVLQHGSIPLSGDLGRICDGLIYADEMDRERGKEQVRARAITLSEALGREVEWRTIAEAIVGGFAGALDIDFGLPETLTVSECERAEFLASEVYSQVLDRKRR
jgi:lipoate-protein ligase A